MAQGVDPVLRTYNTLIIACNMCGQPREAMAVYRRMLDAGYSPNATTYNALISAYGKNGQLDKARPIPLHCLPHASLDAQRLSSAHGDWVYQGLTHSQQISTGVQMLVYSGGEDQSA